jgi:hypothetical protein
MAGKDHILPSDLLALPIDLLLPAIPRLPSPVCLSCNMVDEKPEAKAARVQGLRKGPLRNTSASITRGRGTLGGGFVTQGHTGQAGTIEA